MSLLKFISDFITEIKRDWNKTIIEINTERIIHFLQQEDSSLCIDDMPFIQFKFILANMGWNVIEPERQCEAWEYRVVAESNEANKTVILARFNEYGNWYDVILKRNIYSTKNNPINFC